MQGGRGVRLAVRAIILRDARLLLVNAWPGTQSDLWCAPGGGVEVHASLPANLIREVHEETGLTIAVDGPCLVNEFHVPPDIGSQGGGNRDFHQVDVYFRARIVSGDPDGPWTDPDGVVNRRLWVTRGQMARLRVKPDSLAAIAWGDSGALAYDPLEPLVR